jgi:hypothetical protein
MMTWGYAMPEKAYYMGERWSPCPSNPCPECGMMLWGSRTPMAMHRVYERQIRVYLDRAPRGSKRVRIVEVAPE